MRLLDLLEDSKRICSQKNKLEDLPVAKDIARLAKKFTIELNSKVIEFTDYKTNQEALFEILRILGLELQNITITREMFEKQVNPDDHYTISHFIVDQFGESGMVSSLLKTIHQTIVARVLHRVKDTLVADSIPMQIRDSRGQWKIKIKILKDKLGNLLTLSSTHERKEIAYQRQEGVTELVDLFVFSWEYVHLLNVSTGAISSVEMNLLDTGKQELHYSGLLRNVFVNSVHNIDSVWEGGKKPWAITIKNVFSSSRFQLILVGLCLTGVVWLLKKYF
jgi:hypothetical protein